MKKTRSITSCCCCCCYSSAVGSRLRGSSRFSSAADLPQPPGLSLHLHGRCYYCCCCCGEEGKRWLFLKIIGTWNREGFFSLYTSYNIHTLHTYERVWITYYMAGCICCTYIYLRDQGQSELTVYISLTCNRKKKHGN